MSWPPQLDELKVDLSIEPSDTHDDVALSAVLDAAVAHVQRVHQGRFAFDVDGQLAGLPTPPPDMCLGVVRQAGRWFTRRRSPDGLIQMADLGSSRVPSFDPDIERMLRIGRYAPAVIA